MHDADLPRAQALSALAGWNQTEDDWRLFLRHGRVWVADDGDPRCLAATAAVLPFGAELAWVSMVLVRPDLRRQGIATRLMQWAIDDAGKDRTLALDATPAGQAVYAQLGFHDVFTFTRWRLVADSAAPAAAVHALRDDDWPAVHALDQAAFGTPRAMLLHAFAGRLPASGWIADDGSGFALGRDGAVLPQIGPVVARDPTTALALIAAAKRAIGGAVLLDLADSQDEIATALSRAGTEPLRSFTRMARGGILPGRPRHLIAMAGPEFG